MEDIGYDPLAALAVRISTPHEQEFLKENIRHIEDRHGTAFAADLVRAISLQDMEAAGRVASMLCPDAGFSHSPSGAGTRVEWSQGEASGSTDMHHATPPQAIVSAAINARRALENSVPAPRP